MTKRVFDSVFSVLGLVAVFMVTFSGTAWAATAASDTSLLDVAKPVFEAILSGKPGLAAALALVLVAAVARKYAGKRIGFFNTDAGGAVLVLLGSFGGAAAAAITGGASWSFSLGYKALAVAFSAAGGYSLVKRLLVEPVLRPLFAKAPGWAQPFLGVMLWFFDKPDPVAEAVLAGNKAVEEKPSPGVEGLVGKATEVE